MPPTESVTVAVGEEGAGARRSSLGLLAMLSAMMFLQYAVWGSWAPVLAKHLANLGLSGRQIGNIYSTMAIASMATTWLGGQLADRIMRAERVLFLSHLVGAIVLWVVAAQTSFRPIFALALLYAVLYVQTLTLTNLVAFRHLASREREFGAVRLWGTIGWIIAGWALGAWLRKPAWLPLAHAASLADCLRQAALLSLVTAVFCLFLPKTPPVVGARARRFAPLGALKLLRQRSFATLLVVGVLLAVAMQFYYVLGAPFLGALGVKDHNLSPLLTIGQVCEIVALALLPLFVRWLGVKGTFLLGIGCWATRFGVFAAGEPWPLVVASLGLHGFCYAFVFALGQMYVDAHADADVRASAQSLFAFATLGVGMYLGALAAGGASDYYTVITAAGEKLVTYRDVFLWPTGGAAACLLLFAVLFKSSRPRAARQS